MKTIFKNAQIVGVNVNPLDYHKTDVKRGDPKFIMTRSNLVDFHLCPHKWVLGGGDNEETKSTLFGSLVDCLALTPEQFEARYAVCPEEYPCEPTKKDARAFKPWNLNADWCKNWVDEQSPKTCIKPSEYDAALSAMVELKNSYSAIIEEAEKQVWVMGEYRDDATGIVVTVKTLLDLKLSKKGMLGDLKTSMTAEPRAWGRLVNDRGYDVQAAMSMDLVNSAEADSIHTFFHIVVENYAPYEVMWPPPFLTAEFIELGRTKYLNALRKYCHCLKTGEWPSYQPVGQTMFGMQPIDPPKWATENAMENHWTPPTITQREQQPEDFRH